jgi:glycerol-3-phosphate dehydrogenase
MRNENIVRLARETFDLVIIGGGITGAGIAQDAAARGLKVALVERKDFASGTSSKSSKLIHGGLRYLKQLDIGVTRESCAERNRLLKLAPRLVKPLRFLFPLYRGRTSGWLARLGLMAYDRIAGSKGLEPHHHITTDEAMRLVPLLRSAALNGGLVYQDAMTDDARLTITVIKSAMQFGAVIANYAEVIGLRKTGDRVCGIAVRDTISGDEFDVRANVVINASGVWIDQIRALDGNQNQQAVKPSKGIHIILPQDTLNNQIAVVLTSTRDKRMMFAIPWQDVTVVGTTDTFYHGDLNAPRAEAQDIDYVLETIGDAFDIEVKREQIISTYAGLRPLVSEGSGTPSDLSRKHKIFESSSGLITIAGGKLTSYRKMAADIVDLVARRVPGTGPCITAQVPLFAGDALQEDLLRSNLDPEVAAHLNERYGADAVKVLETVKADPRLSEKIIKRLPYIKAEIIYALRYEMAMTLEDMLARRTRIILQDRTNGLCCAEEVSHIMASELRWSEPERARQLDSYTTQARLHNVP